MKKSIASLVALAACALALTTTAPAANAQGQDQVVIAARAEARPWVVAFTDAGGQTQPNQQVAQSVTQAISGSDWQITASGLLTISKGGQKVLQTPAYGSEDKAFFLLHYRNGAAGVEGSLFRFRDEPTKGLAMLWVHMPSQDGKSVTTVHIETMLEFPAANNGGTGDNGGFGGFGN
jgi:hypothetical protein